MKYKIGDRFKVDFSDAIWEITEISEHDLFPYGSVIVEGRNKGNKSWWKDDGDMHLVAKKTSMKDLLQKASLVFKGEPQKSYIKAGIMDINELPTNDGVNLYIAYLMKKDTAFKTEVVDVILAEEEKNK